MRILFVTSNRLGDAVLSTGLLDHLIRTYPDVRITVVCGPVAEGVFERMPNRTRTIVLRKQPWGRHWLPLWADVALHVWDLVVDIRGSALSWLVPTRRRAVFRRPVFRRPVFRRPVFGHPVFGRSIFSRPAFRRPVFGRSAFRRPVFRRIAGPKIAQLGAILDLSPPPPPVAWTSEADRRHVSSLLPIGRPIIALAPTANWDPKVWPAAHFAAVFHRVAGAGAVPVVLGGPGPAEHAMAEPLLALLPGAIDLVGRLTLPEVVACLENATLFIGNDSGLMHLSAAAGAPTIGLFGPTDAATYAPTGRLTATVIGTSMAEITVEQVADAAERLLAQKTPT
jgi:ADP-heptose:LPS heptosyltransferase